MTSRGGGTRRRGWQGSKWIWPSTRLAIYDRDGFRCIWCGSAMRPLCLDHLQPVADGGTNETDNLVTACFDCNNDRRGLTDEEWLDFLFAHRQQPQAIVLARLDAALEEPLDRAWAVAMCKQRPPWLGELRRRASHAVELPERRSPDPDPDPDPPYESDPEYGF